MVDAAGLSTERVDVQFELDMHYLGQTHTIAVPLPGDAAEALTASDVKAAFETAYQKTFSRLLGAIDARIVNLRTAAIGRRPRFDLATLAPEAGSTVEAARRESRPVWFDGAWHDTAVYDRLSLPVGAVICGPAILEQGDATTVVDPDLDARVDGFGNLILERRP